MAKSKKLKLFVWEDVLCDYTCGIMFALAPDVETARKILLEKEDSNLIKSELMADPDVIETEEGFVVWGGG